MSFDPDLFRPISLGDLTMPGGWSVSSGQTFLYTPDEIRLMHEADRRPRPAGPRRHRLHVGLPVQQIFRDARLMRIGAGSDEIMKLLIARELLRDVGSGTAATSR